MTRLIAFLMFLLVPFAAMAQDETPDTILVLDASGSMWGQIDGVNKIVIAREVIADVLADLPQELELGLMAYGHNRRGDCSDIEMLIDPGAGTAGAIIDAVNAINPRGRTPMSDAVIAAAQALRHTENPATVILVSDGIETCEADPCAVAAELEEAGIGFTAHVIGFDVASEPEARAQMQCLAENTGGAFLTADNAEELAEALTIVAAAPPPAPANVTVTARIEDGSAPVSALSWTLSGADGAALLGPVAAPGFVVELPAGDYSVDVLREAQGTNHGTGFTVAAGESLEVVITLPALRAPVTFEARLDSIDGPLITDPILWSFYENSDVQGNPLEDELASGSYTVEAYWTATEQSQSTQVAILGAAPRTVVVVFETPLPQATLIAPATAVAGSTIEVAWDGPGERNDQIVAADPTSTARSVTQVLTERGNPAALRVPSLPGMYELRYLNGPGGAILASQPLEVTPATATLIAPDSAEAGSTIEIAWDGPAYDPDFISVALPDDDRSRINIMLARNGSPLELQMPSEPGTYELRYVMQQDQVILTRRSIEVTEVLATVIAPDTAVAGSTIEVSWAGPDYQNDFISVANPDDERGYVNYTYTREGETLDLMMPTEPGTYELRYVASQDRTVLATRSIEITAAGAAVIAPDSAVAGSTIEVSWDGPDYQNDFISVAAPDDERGYVNYTYTREGAPLDLLMPTEPGIYEIRYVLNQDRQTLAARTIEVTDVAASVVAPESAVAGSTVQVTWQGPDYQNDFISVAALDDERGYVNYTYTREGAPLDLLMPTEPGTYEIRYVVSQDRQVIASQQIEVTDVGATLIAPDTAEAGATIEVSWTGPDYQNDFISVADPDDERGYVNYTYTREGAPLDLQLPAEPGTYEIRYVVNQDRQTIAARTITVTALAASLSAPAEAVIGQQLTVTWTGPDYQNDFIVIAEPDDARGYETYSYTRDGSPLEVLVPSEPGTYELRYVLNQDRVTIAAQTLTVADLPPVLFDVPQRLLAGTEMQIRHTGPGYNNDFVAFGTPGDDRDYDSFARVSDDPVVRIQVPETPGIYELRYYMAQDRRILGRLTVTVE